MASGEWHEEDRFWELFEPIMFDEARMILAPGEVDALLRLAKPTEGAAVLDLCCGPGRHSVELAKRGFRVTGLDRTSRFLERARRRAGALPVEWVLADARTFVRKGAFDLVVNLYTSFGYFDAPEEDELLARNVAESLRPGGLFVLQTLGKELAARDFKERDWMERPGLVLLEERRLIAPFAAIENRWTLLREGGNEHAAFVVRLYSATELDALLRRAGFQTVRFFGSLDGTPYDQNADRLVAVAAT